MTEEQWVSLLDALKSGSSLRKWLETSGLHHPAVYRFIDESPERQSQYARAKEEGIESRIDAAQEVARTEPDVQRARLIVDLAKWEASKLLPKKYGDRKEVAVNLQDLRTDQLVSALVATEESDAN